ncbi:hypothetical protein EON67_04490 [archaeon]|nr:MAG: hypothetical protein EON67_04490 [archaeon]
MQQLPRLSAGLRLAYIDPCILIVAKPPGLAAVPGCGDRLHHNAATYAEAWFQDLARLGLLSRTLARLPSAFTSVTQLCAASAAQDVLRDVAAAADAGLTACSSRTRRARGRKAALSRGLLPFGVTPQLAELHETSSEVALPVEFRCAPRVVHRLDEATSGLLVFALTTAAHRALSLQWEHRIVRKVYEAVLDTRHAEVMAAASCSDDGNAPGCSDGSWGNRSPLMYAQTGELTTPVSPHGTLPLLQRAMAGGSTVAADGEPAAARPCPRSARLQEDGVQEQAQHSRSHLPCVPSSMSAHTSWRVLERGTGAVRVEMEPHTGRTHQLRVHASLSPPCGLGAPILGDALYGASQWVQRPYAADLRAVLAQRAHAASGECSQVAAFARALAEYESGHADVERTLRDAGRWQNAPYLPSCTALAGVGARVQPLARCYLHAREVVIADSFHGADALLQRAPSAVATAATAAAQQPPADDWCGEGVVHVLNDGHARNARRVRVAWPTPF